jgi:hypothetical protein
MTVWELIKKLEKYDLNARVLTLGYEGGLDDIDVKRDRVIFNTNTTDTWYIGKHEYARMLDDDSNGTDCVIIVRGK